jgi:hypothetical protein
VADDVYKLLQEANWEEIGQQLAGHAAFRAKNLAWRTVTIGTWPKVSIP